MAKKNNMRQKTDKRPDKGLPKLTTREIIASKLDCSPDSFLVYREEPGGTIVAILPDGRKYKFTREELKHDNNR